MSESDLWFTRATLRRDAPDLAPLIARLLPQNGDDGETLNATHQLLWTLMPPAMQEAGKPSRQAALPDGRLVEQDKAAFLWREGENPNSWYLLGPEPRAESPFFQVEAKPYGLCLREGDRLSFDLVVNATVNRMIDPAKGRAGRRRCDVVMDALKADERQGGNVGDRAARRQIVAQSALTQWLAQQGEGNGFRLEACDLLSYRTVELDRPKSRPDRRSEGGRKKQPIIGIGRLRGLVTVSEPQAFTDKVTKGFGRAKAFGCGLMLLRRVE